MTIARQAKVFLGTDETTGVSIASGGTGSGAEVDVLGDDTSLGEIDLYLVATCTVTTGSIDVTVNKRRVTGQVYSQPNPQHSFSPINGTIKYYLGRYSVERFMQVDVKNNGIGASLTNVFVGGTLSKVS
jgi:hypothetical protein